MVTAMEPLRQCPAPHMLPYAALPCALAGTAAAILGLAKLSGLTAGGPEAHGAVGLGMILLFLLALGLLLGYSRDPALVLCALLPLGAALFLRCLSMDHVTLDYQNFLSDWAAFFRDNGGWAAIALPKGDYNVPYLYFLAFLSYLPIPDLYGIKLFSILFDVILAWGGLRLVRRFSVEGSLRPYAAFCLLLLLPTVILNGSYWGQCDVIYGALCLHALASALDERPAGSVVLLALAFSFKLQTVFLIPLWCALWFTRRVRFRHLLLFPVTYLASILPALLLGKPPGDILGVYFHQTVEYQGYLTLNAPSIYALIPRGLEVETAPAARFGILCAFLCLGLLLLILFRYRRWVTDQILLTAAVLMSVGIPLFLPHMHDRYFFLADILTLCWACHSLWRLPHALAVQTASLGGYHAYLFLRYAFPMAWGALLLAGILISSAVILWSQLDAVLPPRCRPEEGPPATTPEPPPAPRSKPESKGVLPMFPAMRRSRQALTPEACAAVLARGTAGVLALSGNGGYPYAVPLSYVYADGKLYFHCAKAGHKLEAIARSDKASFCVVDQDEIHPTEYTTYYRSVIVFGRVRLLTDEDAIRRAALVLGEKYNPGARQAAEEEIQRTLPALAALEMTVEHLTGKAAKELFPL